MRCRLNGSDVTTITTSIDNANGLYVDSQSESVYVLEGVNGSLFQCHVVSRTVNYGQLLRAAIILRLFMRLCLVCASKNNYKMWHFAMRCHLRPPVPPVVNNAP